jgi:hypothetical protein
MYTPTPFPLRQDAGVLNAHGLLKHRTIQEEVSRYGLGFDPDETIGRHIHEVRGQPRMRKPSP